MLVSGCISCDTVAGRISPPGGVIYQDDYWLLALAQRPLLTPGQGFLILKRHCEDVSQLTLAEAAALGLVMHATARAFATVIQPERVHFGLYAEEVRHIHLHVLPRVASLPRGNIPVAFVLTWRRVLARLGLRQPYADAEVARLAESLRTAWPADHADVKRDGG